MNEAATINARIRQSLATLQESASEAGAGALVDDIAKMLAASETLGQLLRSLPEKLDAVDDSAALRTLRHDLRTPINQIKGYCELLQEEAEDAGDDRWRDVLEAIRLDTESLRQAIESLALETDAPPRRKRPRKREVSARHTPIPFDPQSPEERATVLVVDDNAANRDLLSRLLHRDGFRVVTAGDGQEGIRRMREVDVDVVLLDILMPVMDGYETLERLKLDEELRHVPVIMLTSLDEPQSITRCIQAGAEDHLPKPFDPVLLRARLGNSLSKKRARDLERSYLAQIVAEKRRADDLLHGVIPIGVALTGERDEAKLLERILREARRFCGADGGVLYLRDERRLVPVQIQVDSLEVDSSRAEAGLEAESLDVEGARTPVAEAALTGRSVAVDMTDDTASRYDLDRIRRFDEQRHYTTRSLVCLPLGKKPDLVGVLQLWNASRPTDGRIIPFDPSIIEVLESLSLLAAAALEAYRRETELRREIRRLEIRIDEAKRKREVSEITETDYFRQLREKARELRKEPR